MNENKQPPPKWVLDVVTEFARLIRGHEKEIQKRVRAWLANGGEVEPVTTKMKEALAVSRLVAATDRVVLDMKHKSPRTARLAGLSEMIPLACSNLAEEISVATLILADWPAEGPALLDALSLVRGWWPTPSKSNDRGDEKQTFGCLTVFNDFQTVLCKKKSYDLSDAAQARELLRFICTEKALSKDTARSKPEIKKAIETFVKIAAIDWRPAHVFRGNLAALYRDAIGRNSKKGLYWINP
jgi:hypothetical protein